MTDTASVETDLPNRDPRILGGSTERERMRTVIVAEPDDIAVHVAERIARVIETTVRERGQCVLGLATGSTPLGIYRELIRLHLDGSLDFSRVVTFNLDEYYPMRPDSLHSYRRFMEENFFQYVNLPPENVHVPDGSVPRIDLDGYCERYDRDIADAGGIDFQILRNRPQRPHRLQRARLVAGLTHATDYPRHRHPQGRFVRLLRRGQRADRGDHHGHRLHSRGPGDRSHRHR